MEGLPGKSIISAVQDQQDEGACFFVRDRMTAAGQVVVSADVGPATPATGASLTVRCLGLGSAGLAHGWRPAFRCGLQGRFAAAGSCAPALSPTATCPPSPPVRQVVGKLGVPAMRVRATPLNLDPALAVLPENTVATAPLAIYANRAKGVVSPTLEVNGVPDVYSIAVRSWTSSAGRHSLDILNDEVTLGPTFISGALHPESSYVLQLAYPAPGQTLLEAYGSSLEAADLALNADGVLTARRLNSGPLTVSASSGEAALQVLGSATVNGSLGERAGWPAALRRERGGGTGAACMGHELAPFGPLPLPHLQPSALWAPPDQPPVSQSRLRVGNERLGGAPLPPCCR